MSGDAVGTGPGEAPRSPAGRRRSARIWIAAAVVAALAAVGVVTAVVLVAGNAAIHDGPGTATFTWTPVSQGLSAQTGSQPPQPFTADVDGHSMTGTASPILTASSVSALIRTPGSSGSVPAFRYTGQFAGRSFALVLSFRILGAAPSAPSPAHFRITVVGTYGSMPVTATVTVRPTGPTTGEPAHFSGTMGHWKVSGTISPTSGTSARQTAVVHYLVSG